MASRFDILGNLPAELVLEVFDWLPEREVVRLRAVSRTWHNRISGIKWGDKVASHLMNARRDWANRLPARLRLNQLPRTLRHLELSAWRLNYRNAWNQDLFSSCPVLKILVLNSVNEAPLSGATMLAGLRVETLKLVGMTSQHVVAWLPVLSLCANLRNLSLVLEGRSHLVAQNHTRLEQGNMPALQVLEIEIPQQTNELVRQIASRHRQGLGLLLAHNSEAPRVALLDLVAHAPNLNTLKVVLDFAGPHYQPLLFIQFLAPLHVADVRINTVALSGIFFEPRWLRIFNEVTIRRYPSDWHLLISYSAWGGLWHSNVVSLDIACRASEFPARHYPAVLPLAQNLRTLRLTDEGGLFANCLMYTLNRGLPHPLTSLNTLSIIATSPHQNAYPDGHDLQISSMTWVQPAVFEESDLVLLSRWFPRLVSLELINLPGVTDATARPVLSELLPHLETLRIEGEYIPRRNNGEPRRTRPSWSTESYSWQHDHEGQHLTDEERAEVQRREVAELYAMEE